LAGAFKSATCFVAAQGRTCGSDVADVAADGIITSCICTATTEA
jgi:hypothetical protein